LSGGRQAPGKLYNTTSEEGDNIDQLDIMMELGSPESIKNAVAANLGISILSITTIEKELVLNSLCAIPLEKPIHRPFSFFHCIS